MQNRPITLIVAAAVLGLEALACLVLGGYVGVETLMGNANDVGSSWIVAGFGVAVAAGLGWVAWGALTVQRWSRGPAVVTQIFAIPTAITLINADQLGWGIPVIAAAVVVLVTLLAPQSTTALMGEEPHP